MASAISQFHGRVDSACTAVAAMRSMVIDQLIALHNRFEAARRAIDLLRGMANNMALPLIPNLPALLALDMDAYNRIRTACPMLKLPVLDESLLSQLPGIKQLEKIRQMYQEAVSNLLNKMERSALGLIDQLENELNNMISKALKAISPFVSMLDCACAGLDEISNPANLQIAKNFYSRVTKKPTLLDDELKGRLNTFRETKLELKRIVSPLATA